MNQKKRIQKAKPRGAEITCKQVTALILGYLAGELDRKTGRTFEEHLMICPDCVSFLNTYKKTVEAVQSIRYGDIPAVMRRRVRRFLREKMTRRPGRR